MADGVDVVVTRTYRMQARQEAVASTRERILRAAYDQWLEHPYDQVSIESVARAAGVSRQTVIRQFGTKDELAFAVVDWQKPREEAFRSAEPGDIETAIARLVDRYEVMGDANVRILELEGRFPAFDYLLDVSRAGHRAWIERTLLPGPSSGDREQAVLCLYAATDVTVWKLLRRDLKQSRSITESVILRLVRAVLDDAPTGKDQRS
jgi:AcrR family transcriptional regulator